MDSAKNHLFDFAARAGLLARGIVYALVAGLLLLAAIAPGSDDEGYAPGETFRALEARTGGNIVLILISLGLILYAVWRGIQAALDTSDKGRDWKGIFARFGMLMSGISYLTVGVAAGLTLLGQNRGTGGGVTERFSGWVLAHPYGRIALVVFGSVIAAIALAQIWRGATRQWISGFDLNGDDSLRCRLIDLAIIGRGVLIGLVAMFVLLAAFEGDASEAKGLSASLGWLREQPFGVWLYTSAALIIAGYGFYSVMQARYLRVDLEKSPHV